MKKIKKIAPIHLVAEARGKAMLVFAIVVLPLSVIIGILMTIVSFSKGSTSDGLMGLLCGSFLAQFNSSVDAPPVTTIRI